MILPQLTVTHSAAVSPLAAEFIAPPDTEHEFYITSLGANSSCAFRPALSPNQVDYRGIDIDTTTEGAETVREHRNGARQILGRLYTVQFSPTLSSHARP